MLLPKSLTDTPAVMLVNPWIHDFAAYDYWAVPLGLLQMAGLLRAQGVRVTYVNCLDRFHPRAKQQPPSVRGGRGPYRKTRIPKPDRLRIVPRHFSRYGIDPDWFQDDLRQQPPPDLVLVTSGMTYWYPGLQETLTQLREAFPATPIVAGGIYVALCTAHARTHLACAEVVAGSGLAALPDLMARHAGWTGMGPVDPDQLDALPRPALDLQRRIAFAPLLTSTGCPFHCAYCASPVLYPRRSRCSPERVLDDILHWHQDYGCQDFVLYDDAFLMEPEQHALPILEAVIRRQLPIRFHTPNALHVQGLTPVVTDLLARAGFQTLRLGLESSLFSPGKRWDQKVTADQFYQAVAALKRAGFTSRQVGAYLLCGLPGQSLAEVIGSAAAVHAAGLEPVLAYYAPIPHTRLWESACAASPLPLSADPIYTNNALFPCWLGRYSWEELFQLKQQTEPSVPPCRRGRPWPEQEIQNGAAIVRDTAGLC